MYRSGSWGGVNESDEDERLAVLQAQQQDNAYTQIEVVRVSEEARGRSSSGQTEVHVGTLLGGSHIAGMRALSF